MSVQISILIPVHGEGLFLRKTLASIEAQSFRGRFETILVLDRAGSNVRSIAEEFSEKIFLRIIESEKEGLVSALNMGLDSSTGKYIARIDSDDLMEEERQEKQYNFMENHHDVVAVGSHVIEIDDFENRIGIRKYPIKSPDISRELKRQCVLAHPSMMIRKACINSNLRYREVFKNAEDYDLWTRLSLIGKLANLDDYLTFYRVHRNQISQTQKLNQLFGSYSVRISFFMMRYFKRDLTIFYPTYLRWSESKLGLFILSWANFRLNLFSRMNLVEESTLEKGQYFSYLLTYPFVQFRKIKRKLK